MAFALMYRRQLKEKQVEYNDLESLQSTAARSSLKPSLSSVEHTVPVPNRVAEVNAENGLAITVLQVDESDYADPLTQPTCQAPELQIEIRSRSNSMNPVTIDPEVHAPAKERRTKLAVEDDDYNIPFETLTAIRHNSVKKKRNLSDKDAKSSDTLYAEVDQVLGEINQLGTSQDDAASLSLQSGISQSRDVSPRTSAGQIPRANSSASRASRDELVFVKNDCLAPPSPIYAMIDMSRKSCRRGTALQPDDIVQTDM